MHFPGIPTDTGRNMQVSGCFGIFLKEGGGQYDPAAARWHSLRNATK